MKHISFLILFTMIFVSLMIPQLCHSQAIAHLSYENNAILFGDSVAMEMVVYSDPGPSGEGQVWDFSGAAILGDYKCIYALSPDSISILASKSRGLYTYKQNTDSLLLVREESPLYYINYRKPCISMLYPMHYGDNHQSVFSGEGLYCGRINLCRDGMVEIEADGLGTLIIEKGDTLHDVIRVCTTLTASVSQGNDTSSIRRGDSHQEITEYYQWYAPDCRYPVYEIATTTLYSSMNPLSTRNWARRRHPTISGIYDEGYEHSAEGQALITYNIANHQNRITVDYTLTSDARLRVLITDVMGVLYRSETFTGETGHHQLSLDCADLRPGQYILYINANGAIFNSKFTIQ